MTVDEMIVREVSMRLIWFIGKAKQDLALGKLHISPEKSLFIDGGQIFSILKWKVASLVFAKSGQLVREDVENPRDARQLTKDEIPAACS